MSRSVACGNGGYNNFLASAARNDRAVCFQQFDDAGANSSQPGQADSQYIFCHTYSAATFPGVLMPMLRNQRLMLRAACRMRCSFSTMAIRT
jgi:hypothetical protein